MNLGPITTNILLSIMALVVTYALPAISVEKMDIETHSLVIEKLENALEQEPSQSAKKLGLMVRLADLYSERARLQHIYAIEKKCDQCNEAQADRKKALRYYETAFTQVKSEKRGQLLLHMAHLYKMTKQTGKAIVLLKKVIRQGSKKHDRLTIAQAHVALGHLYYEIGKFGPAQTHFVKALKEPRVKKQGWINYRLAWSLLNIGQRKKATQTLIRLLQSDELIQNAGAGDSFKEDVSKDLAIFIAKGPITDSRIDLLVNLSPPQARRGNLFFLGQETDRLGKKKASLRVWQKFLLLKEITHSEQLEIKVRLAQIYYDLRRRTDSLNQLKSAIDFWLEKGCPDQALCTEMTGYIRNFVILWNKAEKTKPSSSVLKAYQQYLRIQPGDIEMALWGAAVAKKRGQWQEGKKLYRQASMAAEKSEKPEDRKRLTGALLGEVEMAEATKDPNIRRDSYVHFLELQPTGKDSVDVRYQLARTYYEQKRYREASDRFRAVALGRGHNKERLRKKAADLSLDSLASIKDHDTIEIWSKEFASRFPRHKPEFYKLSRQATLTAVALTANNKNAGPDEKAKSLARLKKAPMKGATRPEKIKFYMNQLILAESLRNLNETDRAASILLGIKGLTKKDRNYALRSQIWAAEMKLNFNKAYRLTLKGGPAVAPKPREYELRLALLAKLSGKNPQKHYRRYIRADRNAKKANLARASLVEDSKSPWAELKKHIPALKRYPNILAPLALKTFARRPSYKEANRILQIPSVRRHFAGRVLNRRFFLKDFVRLRKKIDRHNISGRSDRRMQKTIAQRLNYLNQLDKMTQKAVTQRDWVLQVLTLNLLADQNRRLHDELLNLPLPRKLNRKQRQQYASLLNQKARPYAKRAIHIDKKLRQFWQNAKAVTQLQHNYSMAEKQVRKLMNQEMKMLAAIAPDRHKSSLNWHIQQRPHRPKTSQVARAKNDLKRHPFSLPKTKHLQDLEKQRERHTMVAYLEQRMNQLERGGRL